MFHQSFRAFNCRIFKQQIASGGNPSLTAISRIIRAVSAIHCAADGCGESTIVLRDLMAMIILKIAVEVGLVEGIIAATTPRGDGDFDDAFGFPDNADGF